MLLVEAATRATSSKVKLETTSTSSAASEKLAENIVEVLALKVVSTTSTLTLLMLPDTLFSLHVIDPSFFRITEDFICVCDFLKACLRTLRVVRVLVWMVFDCQLFERFLYLFISSSLFDPHDLVVVCCRLLVLLLSSFLLSVVLRLSTLC